MASVVQETSGHYDLARGLRLYDTDGDLPFTGAALGLLLIIGLGTLGTGLALRRTRRRDERDQDAQAA